MLTSSVSVPVRNICRAKVPTLKTGMTLLQDGDLSKGSAFTKEERDRLNLRGLLPYKVFTKDEQAARIRRQFELMPTPLLKYIFLANEREKNSQSFWRFLFTHPPEETMPVLYTPTVGEACQKWATHRQSYRGIYITPEDSGKIKDILRNYPRQDIRCIVVTDAGRILGLGDLGASGLGIPVGKLMLYTLIGQVNPDQTLPVQLDMGTDRKEILADPLYHGWRHPRIRGPEHTKFVAEFVDAVKEVFGETCLVQFEDFEMETAFTLLDHFRWRCNCFNDDIEGTAAVAAATLASATHMEGVPDLKNQKIIFIGAGSAATGIANLIVDMAVSRGGITKEQAYKNIIMFDHKGMVHAGRKDLYDFNKPYMHNMEVYGSVLEGVKKFKATSVIGVSGVPGLITKEIVQAACANCERPVIMPLSNPTVKAEAKPHDVYQWSNGKALCATGSPFPVETVNGKKTITAQANNSWIFPAVGYALVTTRARHCPGKVFEVAAESLASLVKKEDHDMGNLLPPLNKIRDYSFGIALDVAKYLIKNELATAVPPKGTELKDWLKAQLFDPQAEYEQLY
uniref:AP65-2 adhesin n=1 Tax=Trichomonas vaginalis TaxID=5722 RepID=Q27234_TRIVA|nr:AP65-2 adhesin [Trichomonas vaginalis]AAA92714.1 hydrogenosomal malic enzyme subunit A proprotein [Trichomonas vaginalis]prf//2210351A malate dehydrogenase:SUBUNIT=A [Trichomonas vaginalis]